MWTARAWLAAGLLLAGVPALAAAESFTIATFNVENYLHAELAGRKAKPAEAKARVADTLVELRADVLALQEVGCTNALLELRARLRARGLDYPHWEHVTGADTNIHVAVLSRFPFVSRLPHTNEQFLLDGRRFSVSRGFAEVVVRVNERYRFTLLAAHLKSKRPVPGANEADLRLHEAQLLREKVDARMKSDPNVNLVVLGDLNDTRTSKPIRAVVGRGQSELVDTRPTERGPGAVGSQVAATGTNAVAWTYFYNREETYSRFDYVLLSRAMANEWDKVRSFVLALPYWAEASDHRPVLVTILAADK
ncbi:MAG: hypothetical protein FJ386_11470 [Verrucomicrobia bacterium]|nr:hypothetical protein [Verrucomicrobiota bacterium]